MKQWQLDVCVSGFHNRLPCNPIHLPTQLKGKQANIVNYAEENNCQGIGTSLMLLLSAFFHEKKKRKGQFDEDY
ncbi:hypothetical protein POVCU2_0048140 [Plasmodium ovale curtisi]|uniref:Uncharacterized protein n=1 Tax=Plasmodium ovale curtisi TaxID=864141 RepID=A0A1A8W8T3_PLAOA|nr:hypothetical protein POVCU2_0048140 [Plasmodium ovale curtisi]SBS98244.1 hypothetical protein POVCU1_044620 [Plasmodium ovale curtisi]